MSRVSLVPIDDKYEGEVNGVIVSETDTAWEIKLDNSDVVVYCPKFAWRRV